MPWLTKDHEEMKERITSLRASIDELKKLKDLFANAYNISDFARMGHLSRRIRNLLQAVAEEMTYQGVRKRRTSADLKKLIPWQLDARLVQYVKTMKNLLFQLDQDVAVHNLYDFIRHSDQAEKICLQYVDRIRTVGRDGRNQQTAKKRAARQSPKMRESFNNWRQWIKETKDEPNRDGLAILREIDEIVEFFEDREMRVATLTENEGI